MVSVLHKELEYKVEKRRGAGEGVGRGGGANREFTVILIGS